MADDPTLINYILQAGWVVKTVLALLILASIYSWTIIVQSWYTLYRAKKRDHNFQNQFWSGTDLGDLYQQVQSQNQQSGLALVFHQGLKEYSRLRQSGARYEAVMEGTERALKAASQRELDELEQNIPVLATIGSTAPYVGLFGTVWGIMASFQGLSQVQQATIAMVAPGISEALVATAMGLFAAIPAVVAYNRYNQHLGAVSSQFQAFQEEFAVILHRDLYARSQYE